MHLLRVSPSQRSGSSAGSGLGGSTFLCTGRLLGTGDPQGKQRYWGSWEAAKGSELGRCEGLLTSFCTAHSRQGQGHGQGQELPALLPPAEEGVCIAGVGKRVLWGLSPSCLGHNGITASWGKPLPVLPALLLHPQQQIWAGMRRRSGIWEVDEKPHLHIAELPGDCGEQSSSHHGSVARRCLPGWPGMQDRVYASVATWGQAGHFGAGKGFPAHLPGGPAVPPLAPTFSTRFFSTAFLSTPSGAGSGILSSDLSKSCSETPSWVLASSSPCREGHECGWGCKSIAWPRGEIEQCGWVG